MDSKERYYTKYHPWMAPSGPKDILNGKWVIKILPDQREGKKEGCGFEKVPSGNMAGQDRWFPLLIMVMAPADHHFEGKFRSSKGKRIRAGKEGGEFQRGLQN